MTEPADESNSERPDVLEAMAVYSADGQSDDETAATRRRAPGLRRASRSPTPTGSHAARPERPAGGQVRLTTSPSIWTFSPTEVTRTVTVPPRRGNGGSRCT